MEYYRQPPSDTLHALDSTPDGLHVLLFLQLVLFLFDVLHKHLLLFLVIFYLFHLQIFSFGHSF